MALKFLYSSFEYGFTKATTFVKNTFHGNLEHRWEECVKKREECVKKNESVEKSVQFGEYLLVCVDQLQEISFKTFKI